MKKSVLHAMEAEKKAQEQKKSEPPVVQKKKTKTKGVTK